MIGEQHLVAAPPLDRAHHGVDTGSGVLGESDTRAGGPKERGKPRGRAAQPAGKRVDHEARGLALHFVPDGALRREHRLGRGAERSVIEIAHARIQ